MSPYRQPAPRERVTWRMRLREWWETQWLPVPPPPPSPLSWYRALRDLWNLHDPMDQWEVAELRARQLREAANVKRRDALRAEILRQQEHMRRAH